MPVLSIPFVFTNGTVADGNQVDADFNTVQNVVNGLDFANIGAAGLYASQIIPTTAAQADFGGSIGYSFSPGVAGQVPLTLTGVSAQTADLFDVFAGTNKLAYIDNGGTWHAPIYQLGASGPLLNAVGNDMYIASGLGTTAGAIHFRTGGYSSADTVSISSAGAFNVGASNASVAGDAGFARTTSTGEIVIGGSVSSVALDYGVSTAGALSINKPTRFTGLPTNGVTLVPAADGNLAVLAMTNAAQSKTMFRVDSTDANDSIAYCARGGNLANMLLVQNNTGAQIANTLHAITGSISAVSTATTVTLSGSAAFSGSAYYLVIVDNSSGGTVAAITSQAAGSFTFTSVNAHSYSYFAIGV